ncbi:MAG TPA: hypothetical protein DCQ93_07980 [Bacteroidetes bacterium]|nr:hypothetical protein [Bacteroidota bacterium]
MKFKFIILFLLIFQRSISQSVTVVTDQPFFFGGTGVNVHVYTTNLDPFSIDLLAENGSVQKHFTKNSLQFQLDTMKDKSKAALEYSVHFTGGMNNHRTWISVHYLVNGKDSILWQKDFYILQLPDPTAYIGDTIVNGKMTREEFLKMYNLGVYVPSFPVYSSWFLGDYDVQYLPPDGNSKMYHVSKNIFGTDLRNQMQAAKPGDSFIFKNIKVDGTDGYSRFTNTVKIEIQ